MEEQRLLNKKRKAAGQDKASICTDLGLHYSSIGQFLKAIKEYNIACRIYKESNELILYAQANKSIGDAYMGLQEYRKALKYFKIHHEVAVQEEDRIEQHRALAQLGHLNLTWYLETLDENNRKLLAEAGEYFIKSLKICDSLPDTVDKEDMLARLLSNLGNVNEYHGDYKLAQRFYALSIKKCLKHHLYEQLYRGYLSIASLFERQDMYQETVKYYNLAIEVAKTLSSNRVELVCAALLSKSLTLIRISDFKGAKQALRKAYKFKTPNKDDRKVIERHLRVVASMCKVEDEIRTCNDQKQLKVLYEKMGDGACDLANFTKAIEYYKKMVELAEKNGGSDKELGVCYFSLGETYKDNGNFKEAEFYFEKEYTLCKNNLKDSFYTICNIADLKEMAKAPIKEIKDIYERGFLNCMEKHNLKEEKRLVIQYIHFLRRSHNHKEAFEVKQYLNSLNEKLEDKDDDASSSSDYESEDSTKVHIGDDIVLSDVTDVSEESDNEVPEPTAIQQSKRRKPSTITFKKNSKGEWPLHVACMKGDQKMVQRWLDVDHPVNVRDNAGWIPLHEAAFHGHVEIVRLLLDHGAAINDRGGSACNSITPLHDAASNGHLQVMELLLVRGASAVAKTDDGNTPLCELKRWYERNRDAIAPEQQFHYNLITKRLEEALDKAGQKDLEKYSFDSPRKENVYKFSEDVLQTPEFSVSFDSSRKESVYKTKLGKLRRSLFIDEDFVEEKKESSEDVSQTPKPATSNKSTQTNEEDFVDLDEWPEDYRRPTKSKKRRTDSCEFLSGTNRSFDRESSSSLSPAFQTKSKFGLKRSRTEDVQLTITNSGTKIRQAEVEIDTTTRPFKVMQPSQPIADPMLYVEVEIAGRIFSVPVLMSQIHDKTIKWLAEEAAHKCKESMKLVLELEFSNGAILNNNDALSSLFPLGSMHAEKVVGKVTEWRFAIGFGEIPDDSLPQHAWHCGEAKLRLYEAGHYSHRLQRHHSNGSWCVLIPAFHRSIVLVR